MFQKVLDLFFKPSLVDTHVGDIRSDILVEQSHSLRARRIDHLDTLVSFIDYRSSLPLQRAIYTLKYKRMESLVEELGELLLDVAIARYDETAVIIPVPLHWKRFFDRGFNQAEVLARYVGDKLEIPLEHPLKRTRDTGHQAWRSKTDRMQAMKDAFAIRSGSNIPRRVILVDDIATTGATLDACAKVLKERGAERVEAWVIARG